jgi:hypothetical protein
MERTTSGFTKVDVRHVALLPAVRMMIAAASLWFAHPALGETNHSGIGLNVCPVYDEDPLKLFADAVKSSRGFSVIGNHMAVATTDAHGWPLTDAGDVMFSGVNYADGVYKLYFTTQNASVDARTVHLGFEWGQATASNQVYDAATNTVRYDVTVPSTSPGMLLVDFTNTQGGVRNVKFMRPIAPGSATSYDTSVTFTTPALNLLRKFSVLRFWQVLNTGWDNYVANWSDRTTPDYSCQQCRFFGPTVQPDCGGEWAGVAWEYLIQLCNELNVDLYANIQFLATDDYVRQLAQLIKAKLNPNLKVYTEYSNELWNGSAGYDMHRNHDSAVAEVNRGGSPLDFDSTASGEWTWAWRRVAKRGKEISDIFRSVFGDSAMMTRVRPLLMTQLANGQATLGTGLMFMYYYYDNPAYVSNPHLPSYFFYGAGGAPYYSPAEGTDINTLWSSGDFDTTSFVTNELVADINLCATFGIKRVAYEGGPQLPNNSVGAAAWPDGRITKTITDHHTAWTNYGGDLFVYYADDNWGNADNQWSFIHNIEEPNTPKMAAIDSLNAAQMAPVTFGNVPPCVINGSNSAVAYNPQWGTPSLCRPPEWFSYILRVQQAGVYGVTVGITSNYSTSGSLKLYLDGVPFGSPTLVGGAQTTAKCTTTIYSGMHGIWVQVASLPGSGNPWLTINRVNVALESIIAVKKSVSTMVRHGSKPAIEASGGRMRLRIPAEQGRRVAYALCTVQGRLVAKGTLDAPSAGGETTVQPKGGVGDGMYILHTTDGSASGVLAR